MAALSQVEDVESYSLMEPPPLDWRSDSSSEPGSADDLDDLSSVPPSVETLDKASGAVLLPLNTSDNLASLEAKQQEDVGNIAEPVHNVTWFKDEDAAQKEEGVRSKDLKSEGGYQEEEPVSDVKISIMEEEVEGANGESGDEDHSSIHSLVNQLHLMEEEPHPSPLTPALPLQHRHSSLSEPEPCTPSLLADNSTETTGLLFSESHHQDLLGMLQFTEISANSHPTRRPHRGEVDAVVSVSYNQEDAERFWEHYRDGGQQRHGDESFASLPDDEYPEAVWKKRYAEPLEGEEAVADSEQVGCGTVDIIS